MTNNVGAGLAPAQLAKATRQTITTIIQKITTKNNLHIAYAYGAKIKIVLRIAHAHWAGASPAPTFSI